MQPIVCFYKVLLAHPFIGIVIGCFNAPITELSSCGKMLSGLQNLKYLITGPSKKKFANSFLDDLDNLDQNEKNVYPNVFPKYTNQEEITVRYTQRYH